MNDNWLWAALYALLSIPHERFGCAPFYPHICNLLEYAHRQSTLPLWEGEAQS